MKYTFSKLITICIIMLLIPGTSSASTQNPVVIIDQSGTKIVANLSFLGDFADALYGGNAEITSMINANQDPHFYEPGPSELTAMSEADVILALGSIEFDKWLTDYIAESGDSNLQNKLETVANPTDFELTDPLTGTKNPHFWLDPANAIKMVNNTAKILLNRGLIEINTVVENEQAYTTKLEGLIDKISELKDTTFDGKKVVVDHPSFFYLLRLLGIDRVGALEEKEGEEPSPLHIQELKDKMKQEDVDLIVASKIQAGEDVEQLARDTGAKIAYLTPLTGITGAEDYIAMIEYNLNALLNPEEPANRGFLNTNYFPLLGIVTLATIRKKLD